jgi:hypothetical protein
VDINKTIESLWTMLKPQAASIIRGGFKVLAGTIGGWGALKTPGSQEQFIDLGTGAALYLIGQGWSWWVTSGQSLFADQIEVYQAKIRAQAIKLRDANLPPVTVNEITQNSVKDKAQVVAVIATMPPAVQASIAGMTGSGVKGALVLAILLLGALAWPGNASAQTRLKLPIDPLHLNSTSSQPTAVLNDVMTALAKPFQDLANFIGGDADGAASLATVIPNLQDVNGKACWVKMQEAGAVFKAHPVPLTFKLMTDFESLRLLQMTTNDLCSYTPCTVVFSDASNLVTGVAAAVGGALASSMQIPNLTTLCSRIPQIAPQLPTAVTGLTTSVSTPAASQSTPAPFQSTPQGNPALGAGPVNPAGAPAVTPPAATPAPVQP